MENATPLKIYDTPWQVDEDAGQQDGQEKKQEAQSLFLRILALPTSTTAEGNRVADCAVPGMNFCCGQNTSVPGIIRCTWNYFFLNTSLVAILRLLESGC